jgi:ketopantoate reductase
MEVVLEGKSSVGALERPVEELRKEGIPRTEGAVRWKRVKDYSRGSLRDTIHRCENLEEFEEIWGFIQKMAAQKKIPNATINKLNKLGKAKHAQLSGQRVLRPTSGKLILPGGVRTGGGLIIG